MNTQGTFTKFNNELFYKIRNSQTLNPFFIQVASASDIWIFMSSKGGLTAGRKNADNNLFPYETEDRLHHSYDTGSKTFIKVNGKIWQPFENGIAKYQITQNIYKSYYGNSVVMEEINHDLNISFSYKYESSEKYGFIKTSCLKTLGEKVKAEVLDGLMNIMPYGVNPDLQANASTLVDAYKAAEMVGDNLAVFSMTTQINDTPNPIEVLKANVAFNTLKNSDVYLNTDIIESFKQSKTDKVEKQAFGKKSAYFVKYSTEIENELSYSFVLDAGFDHGKIENLLNYVNKSDFSDICADIKKGTKEIIKIVASADGIQKTGDKVATAHHYLNTLYNVMRGGTFENGYDFDANDFIKNISAKNIHALDNKALLSKIEKCTTIHQLKEACKSDALMYRLALEYLPLSFSRRHGDPSRPWNKFNINLKDENGEKISNYEGNWRDIFQNWEALGLSFPCYYENMVAKFVNASTADGFNPYRINQFGIDWEKPEPENPFGGYGYWGDHQIIYLLRLLKGLNNHFPEKLNEMLSLDIFSYANVPYVITSYENILKDSKNTINFDFEKDEAIENLTTKLGTDAKLIQHGDDVYTVCLTEKLLVPMLSKLSNLLVGGGIWMNTQRPEWNDANNAIVGIGLSMVTVYHVKAYIEFMREIFKKQNCNYEISTSIVKWFEETLISFKKFEDKYNGNEKTLLDELGMSFSKYRTDVYKNAFNTKTLINSKTILDYLTTVGHAIDYTIAKNSGEIYSTYNLLNQDFSVSQMNPMLEGQSAIIGSGSLGANEVSALLSSMKKDLYSEKLRCHTLYPIVKTKPFVNKNNLNITEVIPNITTKDVNGNIHFESEITTSEIINKRTKNLNNDLKQALINEFENQFAHGKFTGRSQVMYKFEGIGCVYWHQNAKLALAVMETVQKARENGENAAKIYTDYKNLMSGFIFRKTPSECGAIPVEPYSHTSFGGKSEQPGMTGQVKESVIMRRAELGISVKNGQIYFDNWFIPETEFDKNDEIYITIYSVPTIYKKSNNDIIKVTFKNGEIKTFFKTIDVKTSKSIFERNCAVEKIEIEVFQ
ncbi:MAG: hypothetical protein R3Y35_07050 [Clostridia bacterium]